MAQDRAQSLTGLFFARSARLADKPFLWVKRPGPGSTNSDDSPRYQSMSWRETAEKVNALARGLLHLGLAAGDRVCLVAENRPEWLMADLAILAAGGVTVPAYCTNGVTDHLHILTDSGARFAIVSTAGLAARLLPAAARAKVDAVLAPAGLSGLFA
ncbi:MAG TPA: AMP-binding protein [Alphaproteobacteria bacterium]